MPDTIKIGTRDSALALWQAEFVKARLEDMGFNCELTHIKSDGEADLVSPLYEMGVQGIFTRALDIALLNGKIDLAVHSLKDVPTQLPKGVVLAAVPERGNSADVLVYKDKLPTAQAHCTVATSSLRRSAQWKHKFPGHDTPPLRGNINTRLRKLIDNQHWTGALFAAAGIERIKLEVPQQQTLDWMVPAPAQGALGVVCREADNRIKEICSLLNHPDTALVTSIERTFLRRLMGGCSMPIGCHASLKDDKISLDGVVLTTDGEKMASVKLSCKKSEADHLAESAVSELLDAGGGAILETFKRQSDNAG